MSSTTPTKVQALDYAKFFLVSDDRSASFKKVFPDLTCEGQSLWEAGSRFHSKVIVQQSIAELRDEIQTNKQGEALFNVKKAMEELEEARESALAPDEHGKTQASAAVSATMGKAKIAGLLVERVQHGGHVSASHDVEGLQSLSDRVEDLVGKRPNPDS